MSIFDKLSESGFISKIATGVGAIFGALNTFFQGGGTRALSIFGDIMEHVGTLFEWIMLSAAIDLF